MSTSKVNHPKPTIWNDFHVAAPGAIQRNKPGLPRSLLWAGTPSPPLTRLTPIHPSRLSRGITPWGHLPWHLPPWCFLKASTAPGLSLSQHFSHDLEVTYIVSLSHSTVGVAGITVHVLVTFISQALRTITACSYTVNVCLVECIRLGSFIICWSLIKKKNKEMKSAGKDLKHYPESMNQRQQISPPFACPFLLLSTETVFNFSLLYGGDWIKHGLVETSLCALCFHIFYRIWWFCGRFVKPIMNEGRANGREKGKERGALRFPLSLEPTGKKM